MDKKYLELLKETKSLTDSTKFQQALKKSEKAIEINKKGCFDLHLTQAKIFFGLNKFKQAQESINTALKLKNDSHEAHLIKGNILYELDEKEECIKSYNQGLDNLENSKAYEEYFIYKGNVLVELNRKEEALEIYDEIINRNSEEIWVYANKGKILKIMGKYEEALKAYQKASSMEPENQDFILKIGKIFSLLNQKGKALENIKKSMVLNDLDVKPFYYKSKIDSININNNFEENNINNNKKNTRSSKNCTLINDSEIVIETLKNDLIARKVDLKKLNEKYESLKLKIKKCIKINIFIN